MPKRLAPVSLQKLVAHLPAPLAGAILWLHSASRTDWAKVRQAIAHERSKNDLRPAHLPALLCRMFWGGVTVGVTPKEYMWFEFESSPAANRSSWVGKRDAMRLQSGANRREEADTLRDKVATFERLEGLVGREWFARGRNGGRQEFALWYRGPSGSVIFAKDRFGTHGKAVRRFPCDETCHPFAVWDEATHAGLDLFEEGIHQHPELLELNPGCVNTVRVMTAHKGGRTVVIDAVLKIGSGTSHVDNWASGGFIIPIDRDTGVLSGAALGSQPECRGPFRSVPPSHRPLKGLPLPNWEDVLRVAKEAHGRFPGLLTVGWDIAITPEGASIVEGNDTWDLLVWQLPFGEGRRARLQEALRSIGVTWP